MSLYDKIDIITFLNLNMFLGTLSRDITIFHVRLK